MWAAVAGAALSPNLGPEPFLFPAGQQDIMHCTFETLPCKGLQATHLVGLAKAHALHEKSAARKTEWLTTVKLDESCCRFRNVCKALLDDKTFLNRFFSSAATYAHRRTQNEGNKKHIHTFTLLKRNHSRTSSILCASQQQYISRLIRLYLQLLQNGR